MMRKGRVLWHAKLTDRLPPLEISCKGVKEKESGELGDRRVANISTSHESQTPSHKHLS